jgi:plastocyanin
MRVYKDMVLLRTRKTFGLMLLLLFLVLPPAVFTAQDLTVKGHVTVTAPAGRGRLGDNADAVIWLTPVAGNLEPAAARNQPPPGHYQLLQQGKRFRPHILVVPVGALVEFPNHDPFFHNVFSLFDGKRFDLGLYEAGSTRIVNFNSPGVSYIFCNIHPEMSAVVVATKSPYYALSNAAGDVLIKHVPPGRYELNVWHERCLPDTLKALSRELVISPSSAWVGDIQLTEAGDLLAKHKNKYGRDYDASTSTDSDYAQP